MISWTIGFWSVLQADSYTEQSLPHPSVPNVLKLILCGILNIVCRALLRFETLQTSDQSDVQTKHKKKEKCQGSFALLFFNSLLKEQSSGAASCEF